MIVLSRMETSGVCANHFSVERYTHFSAGFRFGLLHQFRPKLPIQGVRARELLQLYPGHFVTCFARLREALVYLALSVQNPPHKASLLLSATDAIARWADWFSTAYSVAAIQNYRESKGRALRDQLQAGPEQHQAARQAIDALGHFASRVSLPSFQSGWEERTEAVFRVFSTPPAKLRAWFDLGRLIAACPALDGPSNPEWQNKVAAVVKELRKYKESEVLEKVSIALAIPPTETEKAANWRGTLRLRKDKWEVDLVGLSPIQAGGRIEAALKTPSLSLPLLHLTTTEITIGGEKLPPRTLTEREIAVLWRLAEAEKVPLPYKLLANAILYKGPRPEASVKPILSKLRRKLVPYFSQCMHIPGETEKEKGLSLIQSPGWSASSVFLAIEPGELKIEGRQPDFIPEIEACPGT